jgi:hypothetical protein
VAVLGRKKMESHIFFIVSDFIPFLPNISHHFVRKKCHYSQRNESTLGISPPKNWFIGKKLPQVAMGYAACIGYAEVSFQSKMVFSWQPLGGSSHELPKKSQVKL